MLRGRNRTNILSWRLSCCLECQRLTLDCLGSSKHSQFQCSANAHLRKQQVMAKVVGALVSMQKSKTDSLAPGFN